jgi:hypothetical protein
VVEDPKLLVMSLRTTPLSASTSTPLEPSPGKGPAVSSGISSLPGPTVALELPDDPVVVPSSLLHPATVVGQSQAAEDPERTTSADQGGQVVRETLVVVLETVLLGPLVGRVMVAHGDSSRRRVVSASTLLGLPGPTLCGCCRPVSEG